MKEHRVCIPSPFDDSAITRLARMGLCMPDGTPNEGALETLAQVYAALFFESLCDMSIDLVSAIQLCKKLAGLQQSDDIRHTLISICLQYDAMLCSLPDPVWWITGNEDMVKVYIRAFLHHLETLISTFPKEMENC